MKVKIQTMLGDIVVRLYDETPIHRDNFVKLVKEGYYDGTLFHRVIKNFMILVLAMGVMPIAGFSQQKKTVVKRPKLPIEYVEKYNVGAQDDKNNTSRYMSCDIASAIR